MDVNITADEMIQELLNRISQLEMELAGARIIINKLRGNTNGEVPQGQFENGSEVPQEVG